MYAIDEIGYGHIDGYFPLCLSGISITERGCTGMKSKLAKQLSNAKLHDPKSSLPC
jgi:hypothetical protein